MSDEEQTQDPNAPVIIRLELRSDGSFSVSGPLNNPILFLGMLGMAQQRLQTRMLEIEMMQAKKEQADKPRLYTPDGVRVHRS